MMRSSDLPNAARRRNAFGLIAIAGFSTSVSDRVTVWRRAEEGQLEASFRQLTLDLASCEQVHEVRDEIVANLDVFAA
jgi:hypothetical protein